MVGFLKAAIQIDPDFALAYSRLAKAYQQVPFDPEVVFNFINIDSVLILCDKAIELDPSFGDPYLRRAEYYANFTNDLRAATKDYENAISIDPLAPETYLRYGWFQHNNYWDLVSEIHLIFQGLQKQPDSWLLAEMLAALGWVYTEIASYQQAEDYYTKALIYAPDNLIILENMVQLYRVSAKFDKSLETIHRMMAISPLNRGLLSLGMHYNIVGDYTQSVKYFEEYFTNASETATWTTMHQNHNYAYSLMKIGKIKEANERFEIVLQNIAGWGGGADYEYAKIFSAKGILDSAYYHLGKAVSGPIHWGMSDHMDDDRLFENIKDEPEFQRLMAIAKDKVRRKREEVQRLEEIGEIPKSVEELELY